MKIVYQAENIIDANLVKNALEHDGITAFVSGQYLTGAAGELPPIALVNVMVAELDWPRSSEKVTLRTSRSPNLPLRGKDFGSRATKLSVGSEPFSTMNP